MFNFDQDSRQLWQREIESVFDADYFDLDDWMSASSIIPSLEMEDRLAGDEFCGHPVQDGFLSLYKSTPMFADPADKKLSPLAGLMNRGMQTPEWKKLRENTIGQIAASAVGSQTFIQNVMKNLPDEIKEAAREQSEAQEQADQAQAKADNLQTLANLLRDAGDEAQADQVGAQAKAEQETASQHQQAADTASGEFEEAMEENQAQVAAALNKAAEAAQDEAQEAQMACNAFGLAAGGEGHADPETARMAMLAMQQNPNLRKLAEMLGWAKRTVRGEWRKATKGNKNMTGYAAEPLNPSRMASSELVAMTSSNQAIRLDFARRVVENAVTHRRFDGDEQQGRGPLVLIRDESGSMRGGRHALAVALEWALLEVARRDKRDFYSIPFSGTGQYEIWQAPAKGQPDPKGLLAHLGHFYGGGTDPYPPTNAALDLIAGQSLKADILVITDGSFDQPAPEFLEKAKAAKAAAGIKIVTVTIGGWGDAVAGKFSDKVVAVRDLLEERDELRKAIAEIV